MSDSFYKSVNSSLIVFLLVRWGMCFQVITENFFIFAFVKANIKKFSVIT